MSGKIPACPDDIQEVIIMDNKQGKHPKIEIRMTEADIKKLDERAEAAHMNRSNYVRAACLKDDKLVVLQDFTEVVRLMSEIDGKLTAVIVSDDWTAISQDELNKKLEQIVAYLMRIDEQLDDLNKEEEI